MDDPSFKIGGWSLWETITGAVGGAFTAVVAMFKLFNKRITMLDDRIKKLEQLQGRQEEQHEANLNRFTSIDNGIASTHNKIDGLIKILLGNRMGVDQ